MCFSAKTIVIAVSSLFARGAFAQASVTLYGVADAGLFFATKSPGDKGHAFQFLDSGLSRARFGFKGSEDIGGGTYIGFALESGISLATGKFANSNGNLFGRRAFIEIQNQTYGRMRAGVQFSPFVLAIIGSDPRSSGPFETPFTGSSAVPYVQLFKINGLFYSNANTYLAPTNWGVYARIEYSSGGRTGNFYSRRRASASLMYNQYGISGDAAY